MGTAQAHIPTGSDIDEHDLARFGARIDVRLSDDFAITLSVPDHGLFIRIETSNPGRPLTESECERLLAAINFFRSLGCELVHDPLADEKPPGWTDIRKTLVPS
jgi:hypothetical protein